MLLGSICLLGWGHPALNFAPFAKPVRSVAPPDTVKKAKAVDVEIDEEKIDPEGKLKDDLGIDSLDFVDIVVIVEKKFGFKIKPEEMAGITTLGQFCDYIESKVNNA